MWIYGKTEEGKETFINLDCVHSISKEGANIIIFDMDGYFNEFFYKTEKERDNKFVSIAGEVHCI